MFVVGTAFINAGITPSFVSLFTVCYIWQDKGRIWFGPYFPEFFTTLDSLDIDFRGSTEEPINYTDRNFKKVLNFENKTSDFCLKTLGSN